MQHRAQLQECDNTRGTNEVYVAPQTCAVKQRGDLIILIKNEPSLFMLALPSRWGVARVTAQSSSDSLGGTQSRRRANESHKMLTVFPLSVFITPL